LGLIRKLAPLMNWLRNFLTRLLKKVEADKHPRTFSNAALRRVAPLVRGDIVNVSGWKDSDKQGALYRDYFSKARSYHVSNYSGSRGASEVDSITDFFLDLQKPLPAEFSQKYDVVFNHTTLEHLPDPAKGFDVLCGLSRDLVILVVPFSQEVHFIAGSFGDYGRFSPGGVAYQLHTRGFKTLLCETNRSDVHAQYVFCVASKKPLDHAELTNLDSGAWKALIAECISHG